MKKLITLLVVVGVVSCMLISFVGCQAQATETPAAEAESTETATADTSEAATLDQTYYYITYVTSISYWIDPVAGFMDACELLGVKGEFLGPVEFDAQEQVQTVESVLPKDPAGIIISPADPDALVAPLKQAMDMGVPVICTNSDVNDESARYGYVGINNYNAGQAGGEVLVDLIDGEGKVAILTMPGVSVHEDRKDGYLDVLENYPDIEVVAIENTQADPSVGVTVASSVLQAHPDLTALIGTDATAGASAGRAVVEADRAGEVVIIGMDRDEDLLDLIRDGVVTASLAQRSYLEEWIALHYAYWFKNDLIKALPDWEAADAPQVPPNTDTGVMVITEDNVDYFSHEE